MTERRKAGRPPGSGKKPVGVIVFDHLCSEEELEAMVEADPKIAACRKSAASAKANLAEVERHYKEARRVWNAARKEFEATSEMRERTRRASASVSHVKAGEIGVRKWQIYQGIREVNFRKGKKE